MMTFEAGTLAGAGSFRCQSCEFAVALRGSDTVHNCPSCGGVSFRRSALFEHAGASPAPRADAPEWLDEAREALLRAGDYLAFEDDDSVRVMPLGQGWTRIGRSLAAQLRLDDPTVSRRHALVYSDEEGARVLDDRSLNGVFRNGRRTEVSELEDGDTIALGRFSLHFVHLAADREEAGVGAGRPADRAG